MTIKRPNIDVIESRIKTAYINANDMRDIVEWALHLERQIRIYANHLGHCRCKDLSQFCTCGYRELWDSIPGEFESVRIDAKKLEAKGDVPDALAR